MQTCCATVTMALVDPIPVFVSEYRPVIVSHCCLFLAAPHKRRSVSTAPTPTPPLKGRGFSVVTPPQSPPWRTCLRRRFRGCPRGRRLRSTWLSCGCRSWRSEEHTSELQSLMRTSYAVFCLKKKHPSHITQPT